MMLHRLRVLALLAAVLFGQWLGLAHAAQHEALEPESALCAYCISGIGAGAAPAPAIPAPLLTPIHAAPHAAAAQFNPRTGVGPPRNRGPPQHS